MTNWCFRNHGVGWVSLHVVSLMWWEMAHSLQTFSIIITRLLQRTLDMNLRCAIQRLREIQNSSWSTGSLLTFELSETHSWGPQSPSNLVPAACSTCLLWHTGLAHQSLAAWVTCAYAMAHSTNLSCLCPRLISQRPRRTIDQSRSRWCCPELSRESFCTTISIQPSWRLPWISDWKTSTISIQRVQRQQPWYRDASHD